MAIWPKWSYILDKCLKWFNRCISSLTEANLNENKYISPLLPELAAVRARVRFLPTVNYLMCFKVREELVTARARKRLLSCVVPLVCFKGARLRTVCIQDKSKVSPLCGSSCVF